MDYWSLLILACAVSIDGFVAGVSYGIKKIIINIGSFLIISGITATVIYVTGNIGIIFAAYLDSNIARIVGGSILIFIGIWMIIKTYITDFLNEYVNLIKILNEPVKADLDCSGNINTGEAAFLGLALALDAVGAGLSMGISGFNTLLVPLYVGVINFIFVSGGYYFGHKIAGFLPANFEMFPGLILIVLGIGRII